MSNLFDFELTPEEKGKLEKLKGRTRYLFYSKRQLEYYNRNREAMKAKYREYYAKNAGKRRERYRESPERMREYARKRGRMYIDTDVARRLRERVAKIGREIAPECRRAKVTKTLLAEILKEEVRGRVLNYLKKDDMKKKIMCIVGDSGVGKTLASLHLKNHFGANVICSYTTRPPRPTEIEGREHHFIDIEPPKQELLAFARFGIYKYFATKAQVQGPCTVYVIDEQGVRDLKKRNKDEFEVYTVYIIRDKKLRRLQGIDAKRMKRDDFRDRFELSEYDCVIENNGTKAEFFRSIEKVYNEIKEGRYGGEK